MSSAQQWSRIAQEYDDTAAHLTRRVARIAFDSVVDAISKDKPTIVDLATGTGALVDIAAEHFRPDSGAQIIASDYAEGMVQIVAETAASRGWHHVRCEVMDAQALTLQDSMCQAAFCIAGVICMPDGPKALQEMQRILVPGGLVCFTTWKSVAGIPLAMESFKRMGFTPERSALSQYPWHDRAWLEELMAKEGFTDARIREAAVDFHVPDAGLLDFGLALKNNPVFGKFTQGMTEEQQEKWPQVLADVARSMYGPRETYDFENVGLIITGRKT